MAVARSRDLTYPITQEWREKVRAELDRRGRGAQQRLAETLKVKPSQITEMLSPESRYSHYVAKVHEHFGWPSPVAPVMSPDVEEIRYLIDGMGEDGREFFRALKSMDPDKRKAMVAFALSMAGAKPAT